MLALTVFHTLTADRNPRAMEGTLLLSQALQKRLNAQTTFIGEPQPPLLSNWQEELETARPALQQLAQASKQAFSQHQTPLIVMGRCASALATLPVMAHHHPDALLVWFDAHADIHTPNNSASGYLGGMVIAGAAGQWETGLGGNLALSNVLLVGVRDVDRPEQKLIDEGRLRALPPSPDLPQKLRDAIGKRSVYIHIDCDVLEPGIVPTEYRVPNGLSQADLHACCKVLTQNNIVGLEIAEFESTFVENGKPASPGALLDTISPLLNSIAQPASAIS